VSRLAVALAPLLGAMTLAGAARAEHELYYRYTVLGFVTDAGGHAVPGREVTVVRDKTGFSYLAESDDTGLYVLVLRLGDETVGERLTLRAGQAVVTITVRFDPANRRDERGTRVDIHGTRASERAAAFPSTLARLRGSSR
jgi:hypothetical protein